jgi:hypothetical protein
MTHVYFTSYRRMGYLPEGVRPFACTVYPPKGFEEIPKAPWTDIRDSHGEWVRPRRYVDQPNPLKAYREALLSQYVGRIFEAKLWSDLHPYDVAFLCWCPYDRRAQEQLELHGSYVCHTSVLAEFIEIKLFIRCWLDTDRNHMAGLPK